MFKFCLKLMKTFCNLIIFSFFVQIVNNNQKLSPIRMQKYLVINNSIVKKIKI